MKLTSEEKKICKEYSKRDADGLVHCFECPLAIPDLRNVCKATCTKKEWEDILSDYCPNCGARMVEHE